MFQCAGPTDAGALFARELARCIVCGDMLSRVEPMHLLTAGDGAVFVVCCGGCEQRKLKEPGPAMLAMKPDVAAWVLAFLDQCPDDMGLVLGETEGGTTLTLPVDVARVDAFFHEMRTCWAAMRTGTVQ